MVIGSLILLDVITGILKAGYEQNIQSTIMRKGLYHKLAEILGIFLSTIIENGAQYININIGFPFSLAIISYISVMEILSIIENICGINPDLFKVFRKYLKIFKTEEGDDDET